MAELEEPQTDKALAARAAGVGVVAAGLGLFLRKLGKDAEPQLAELARTISQERVKERVAALSAERKALDFSSGVELSVGTGLLGLGASLVVAALLVFVGVKPRKAILALFPALLFIAVYSVYNAGIESLAVSGAVGVVLLAYAVGGPNEQLRREAESFRRFPMRAGLTADDELDQEFLGHFRAAKKLPEQLLRSVQKLPDPLERLLPMIGEGTPVAYYQLHKGTAYVAIVEADAYNLSDFVTVLMALEEPAPRFIARPLPIVEGKRIPNTGVRFAADPEFTAEVLVEALGSKSDAISEFFHEELRDALLDLPQAWVHVESNAMAVTLYGRFRAERADAVVELADAFFVEYGPDEAPSLFSPKGVIGAGAKKRGKKKPAADVVSEGA